MLIVRDSEEVLHGRSGRMIRQMMLEVLPMAMTLYQKCYCCALPCKIYIQVWDGGIAVFRRNVQGRSPTS